MERAFSLPEDHPLHRWIRGLTEHTFIQCLGLGDPRIVDYVSDLLVRCVSTDSLIAKDEPFPYASLQTLSDLQRIAAEGSSEIAKEAFRRLGDRNLFLTGVFPESVQKRNAWRGVDLKMMTLTGKRAYHVAGDLDRDEAPLMHRLSDHFEICADGLRQVRKAWEAESTLPGRPAFWDSSPPVRPGG